MMPVYRCMDPYPQQNTQMPFTQYYHPGFFEAVPPHMRIDRTNPHLAYESWPCGGNYNYPMPWNSCCNHNSFPGYYSFRPPYPHIPPLSPMHCCGGHPAYHEAYPIHDVPPPRYSMDLPRYEYDKNMPRNYHCCGCPNHTHNQKEDKGMKIEEQEPNVERKGSNSMVPVQMKNFPYPIAWIPQEYMKNKEESEPFKSKAVEPNKVLCATKPPESSKSNEREPRVWNGWFPLDMKSLDSSMQGGDGKRIQNQQNEDKMSQFPFPIIWMPNHDTHEEAGKEDKKEVDPKPESAKEPPYIYNFIPANPPQSDDFTNSPKANEKNFESQGGSPTMEEKTANQKNIPVGEETTNQKNIPVKKMESHKEESSEETQSRGRSVNTMDKASGTSSKRQYSSPPKTPKLSPVCLRVDPLPRKKNGNGSSSSSPPHPKGHSNEAFRATASSALKENPHQDSRSQHTILNSRKEVETYEKDKVIEVMERKNSKDKDTELGGKSQTQFPLNLPMDSQEEVSGKRTVTKTGKDGEECKIQEDKGARKAGDMRTEQPNEAKKVNDSAKVDGDEGKLEKKALQDEEAAMRIQSAYRGYEVRKWEPLKKLKQIAEVHQLMLDVQSRIQILESSSDLQRDDKQIAVIGETIMRLLLKLDTIQGLHPTVRDIRKSLAKELVTLQEKLDFLMIKSSEEAMEEAPTSEHMEQHPFETHNGSCMQEERTEAAAGPGESTSDKNCNSNHELMEPNESLLLDMRTTLSNSQREKYLGSSFANMEGNEKSEVENSRPPVASGVIPKEAEPQKNMEQIDKAVNVELDISQVELKDIERGIPNVLSLKNPLNFLWLEKTRLNLRHGLWEHHLMLMVPYIVSL
ncbi:hypothetical protein SLA2020_318610 [Shorea laevis]